jgi:uncharacterized DUF497 family protein
MDVLNIHVYRNAYASRTQRSSRAETGENKSLDKNLFCKYSVHKKANMKFTWDKEKAADNHRKHDGVTFEEAQTAFGDYNALRIYDPDHSENEDRFILLGLSSAIRLLVVCHCYREDDEQIRIISARKATKNESATYGRRK